MTKAYSYLRFSTPEQERGDSFRRQTTMAKEYAVRHNLDLDERSFDDLGVSGYRGQNAETGMLGEFRELVRAGMIEQGSFLLVESMDRLSRNKPRKAVRLLEQICEEGVTVVTLADGRVYDEDTLNDDPMAFMWAFMVAMRANEESATKARRLKAAWEGKRLRVKERPLTARVPGWLHLDRATKTIQVVANRAEVVRRIFTLILQGVGQGGVAQRLNSEGVPVFGDGKRKGKHWHRSYIVKILGNAAVIGTLTPHRLEYINGKRTRTPLDPVPHYYPAIVDPQTFEEARALRLDSKSPLRGRHAHTPLQNLFGGLAVCPACGGSMTRVNKGAGPKGGRYLVCVAAKTGAGCKYRAVPYDQVEKTFLENAAYVLANAPAGNGGEELDAQITGLETNIEAAQDGLSNLLDAVQMGASIALMDRVRDAENDLEEMKRERDELVRRKDTTAGPIVIRKMNELDFAIGAETLDRTQVNTLLRQLVTAAVVDYRTGRLVLRWKHGGESEVVFRWPEEAR